MEDLHPLGKREWSFNHVRVCQQGFRSYKKTEYLRTLPISYGKAHQAETKVEWAESQRRKFVMGQGFLNKAGHVWADELVTGGRLTCYMSDPTRLT